MKENGKRYKDLSFIKQYKYMQMLCELTGINESELDIDLTMIDSFHVDYTYETSNNINSTFFSFARVMDKFPKFVNDLPELYFYKIITFADNKFIWNEDKTSLALYFYKMKTDGIEYGDFWNDIEEAFSIKPNTLRALASNVKNIYGKPSKGYEKISKFFPSETENKYINKYMEIEKIIEEFWLENDISDFTEHCKAKFAEIKKIIDN